MFQKTNLAAIAAVGLFLFAFIPQVSADQTFAPQIKYYLGGETYPVVFRKDGSGPFPNTLPFSVVTPLGTLAGAAYKAATNPLGPGQSGQLYVADLKRLPGFTPLSNVAYTVNFGNAGALTVKFSGNGNRELLEKFILGIRRWTFGTTEHWSGIPYLADMMREVVGSANNHISIPSTSDRNGACLETLANGTTWCNPALSVPEAQGIIGADGADLRAYPPHAGLTASAYSRTYNTWLQSGYFGSAAAAIAEPAMLNQRYNYGRAFAALIKPNGSAPFSINQTANAPSNNVPSPPSTTAASDDPLAIFSGFYTCARNANARLGLTDLAMSLLSSTHAGDQQMIDTLKTKAAAIASFNAACDDYSPTADLETTLTAMKVNFAHWVLSGIQGSGAAHSFNPSALNSSYQSALENLASRLAQLQVTEGEAGPNSSGPNGIYGYFAKTTNAPDIYYSAPLGRYYSLDVVGRIAQFVSQYSIGGSLGATLKTIMERFIDGYVARTTAMDPAAQPIAASPWHPWEIARLDGTTESGAGGYTPVNLGGSTPVQFRHYRPYAPGENDAHPRSNEFVPGMALALLDMAKALSIDPLQENRMHIAKGAAEKLVYSMFGNNPIDTATVYGGTTVKSDIFARVGPALPCYTSGYPAGCGSAAMDNADHLFTQNGLGTVANDFMIFGGWQSNERHEQKAAATLGALAELYASYYAFVPTGPGYALGLTPAAPSPGSQATISVTTSLSGGPHQFVVIANVSSQGASLTPYQVVEIPGQPAVGIYIPITPQVVAAAQGAVSALEPHTTTYTLPFPGQGGYQYPQNAKLNLQLAVLQNGQWVTGSGPEFVVSVPISGLFGGRVDVLLDLRSALGVLLLVLVALTSILAFVALPKSRGRR